MKYFSMRALHESARNRPAGVALPAAGSASEAGGTLFGLVPAQPFQREADLAKIVFPAVGVVHGTFGRGPLEAAPGWGLRSCVAFPSMELRAFGRCQRPAVRLCGKTCGRCEAIRLKFVGYRDKFVGVYVSAGGDLR